MFIDQANIDRYRLLLASDLPPNKRQTVERLLAESESQLYVGDGWHARGQQPTFISMVLPYILVAFIILAPLRSIANAAEIDGIQIPETLQVEGKTLHLNGFGLRTYSLLAIHIYVASLYLEHPSTEPEAIIRSPETKLLIVRFEHDVSPDEARKTWRTGLENNCIAPCHLDANDVEKFLAMIPAMHEGDDYTFLFQSHLAAVTVGGRLVGTISSPYFADAVLAVFLGPKPASPLLKRELLSGYP